MAESIMLRLLEADDWGEHAAAFDALRAWRFYPLLLDYFRQLDHSALFDSRVHGPGHIERTMLQGGFCAMAEALDEEDTRLVLEACSYHDVGRINDWADPLHGERAVPKLAALTHRDGEALNMLQAAVDAHSRRDNVLEATVQGYHPADYPRALRLAQLLKDADGLDRVRLGDLNAHYLRREASRARVGLAQAVFERYQRANGLEATPFFSKAVIEMLRKRDENEKNA